MGLPGLTLQPTNIKLKVYFNQITGFVGIKDLSPYESYGISTEELAIVKGIVEVLSPSGLEYKNVGWVNELFDNPDLDSTNELEKQSIIDIDGVIGSNFEFGDWVINYKVQYPSNYNGTTTLKTVTTSKTYNYQVPVPTITTTNVFSKNTSILTFTDTSDYVISVPVTGSYGVTLETPSGITRSLTIRPMLTPTVLTTRTGNGTSLTIGPNCWTGNYDSYISSTLTYELELVNGTPTVQVVFGVTYETSTTLEDATNIFNYYDSCINSINETYLTYLNTNPRAADEYKIVRDNIIALHSLFEIYEGSGKDTTFIETKLEEILRRFGFVSTASNVPTEILPLGSGTPTSTTTTTGTTIHSGNTIPENYLGENGDYYLNEATALFYKKILGSWVYVMTLGGQSTLRDSALINDDYTVTDTDELLLVDSSYNSVTLSLSSVSTFSDNKEITIKAESLTEPITIIAYNGDFIDGLTRYTFATEGDTIVLRLALGNWRIV